MTELLVTILNRLGGADMLMITEPGSVPTPGVLGYMLWHCAFDDTVTAPVLFTGVLRQLLAAKPDHHIPTGPLPIRMSTRIVEPAKTSTHPVEPAGCPGRCGSLQRFLAAAF